MNTSVDLVRPEVSLDDKYRVKQGWVFLAGAQALVALIPVAQIQSFREVVPSMNDIFIKVVGDKNILGTQSNFTE